MVAKRPAAALYAHLAAMVRSSRPAHARSLSGTMCLQPSLLHACFAAVCLPHIVLRALSCGLPLACNVAHLLYFQQAWVSCHACSLALASNELAHGQQHWAPSKTRCLTRRTQQQWQAHLSWPGKGIRCQGSCWPAEMQPVSALMWQTPVALRTCAHSLPSEAAELLTGCRRQSERAGRACAHGQV